MKHKKRYLKILILLIIISTIYIIYKINNKNNISYISLGDAFSLGQNSYNIVDYGYSDYIRDYLKDNNKLQFYTKKYSKDDIMISTLYENIVINKKVTEQDKIINIKQTLRSSNILTLSIGMNDLKYKLSIEPKNISLLKIDKIVNETNKEFNNLIKEIKKYYPYKIYVIGYPTVNIKDQKLLISVKKLNYLYQKNKEVVFINPNNILKEEHFLNPNSIYPNKTGYELLSKKIVKIMDL